MKKLRKPTSKPILRRKKNERVICRLIRVGPYCEKQERKFGPCHTVARTNKFPIVAAMEIKVLRTIDVIKIFGLTSKMLAGIP